VVWQVLPWEVVCFGHFLFEMTLGFAKEFAVPITAVKDQCPADIYAVRRFPLFCEPQNLNWAHFKVLESIFTPSSDPQAQPSIKSLLKLPLFKDVQLEIKIHQVRFRFSSQGEILAPDL